MIIIFGGAYQGKLEYAVEAYGIKEEDIFDCKCIAEATSAEAIKIDFSKKVIYHLEQFVFACNRVGIEAKEYLKEHIEELDDKIIIGEDIFYRPGMLHGDLVTLANFLHFRHDYTS